MLAGNWTAGCIPVCGDIFNTSQGFSCIIILSKLCWELSLTYLPVPNEEIWYSDTLRYMHRGTRPTCPSHTWHAWNTSVSSINYNKCNGILSHSRNKVRPALWGCHWLDTSGDSADDGHSMLGWTASSLLTTWPQLNHIIILNDSNLPQFKQSTALIYFEGSLL